MPLLRELESLRKRLEEIPEVNWRFLKEIPEEKLRLLKEIPEENSRFLREIPEENLRLLKEIPEENSRFLREIPKEKLRLLKEIPEENSRFLREIPTEKLRLLKEIPEENMRFLAENSLKPLLETNDRWYGVRKATLNEWSNPRDTRNGQVHSGSVIADIEVIKNHTCSLGQSELWKKTFRYAYGISFDDIKDKDVPMKFYLTLNRRASVTHMYAWKKKNRQKARNEIFKLCDKIIQAWRDKVGFLEEGSESLAQYERMNQWWLSYDTAV
jgi:hypothetical protein